MVLKAAVRSRRMRLSRYPGSEAITRSLVSFEEDCLCAVFRTETRLEGFKQIIGGEVGSDLRGNSVFQYF